MKKWTHTTLQKALNLGSTLDPFEATGVSIDSRTLEKGDMFIALVGEAGDGHDYINNAVDRGASAVIAHTPIKLPRSDVPVIQVPDTLKALHQMGHHARGEAEGHIVAITGSVGKTTTKEILRQVMSKQGKTAYSVASYNNHWGVPLSLAQMESDSSYGIFEVGMNNEGEIRPLAEMIRPHIALITQVCEAHIGHLKTLKAIAKEKATLFYGLEKGGVALLNSASQHKEEMTYVAEKSNVGRILTFGMDRSDDAYIAHYEEVENGRAGFITASILGAKITYLLSLPGIHAAINSVGAMLVMRLLELDMEKVIEAIATVAPTPGRGGYYSLRLGEKKVTLIDDSYNANPTSMKAGLQVLKNTPVGAGGRRIVVLGDMLELGENSSEYHTELVPIVEDSKVDIAFSVGSYMKEFHDRLPESRKGTHVVQPLDLIPDLERILKTGDVVFIKGSKGSKVRLVAQELLNKGILTPKHQS